MQPCITKKLPETINICNNSQYSYKDAFALT